MRTVLTVAVLAVAASAASAATFQGIGRIGDSGSSRALGISADGTVVVGYHDDGAGAWTAVRWEAGELTALPVVPLCFDEYGASNRQAVAASADGSYIVGIHECYSGFYAQAAWNDSGVSAWGTAPAQVYPALADVSDQGNVRVGTGHTLFPPIWPVGMKWVDGVDGGVADPGACPPGGSVISSEARAVSGDGHVILGSQLCLVDGMFSGGGGRYVDGVLENLPLSGRAASFDGSVVVGVDSGEAARWEEGVGLTLLGGLPAGSSSSEALAVSADGSVVVGTASTPDGDRAFLWDAAGGMRRIEHELTAAGFELGGWSLERATGVSADGRTVVGFGSAPGGHEEGWVAFLGPSVPALPRGGRGLLGAALLLAGAGFAAATAGAGGARSEPQASGVSEPAARRRSPATSRR